MADKLMANPLGYFSVAFRVAVVLGVIGLFVLIISTSDPVVSHHELQQENEQMLKELREINADLQRLKTQQERLESLIEAYKRGGFKSA